MLVEASVRPWRVVEDAKQKTEATLELAVSKVINSVPGITPKSEYGAAAHQYMSSMVHYPDTAFDLPAV